MLFTSSVYPDCPAITPDDGGAGDRCNAEKDKALADSKVKAQIFTHLLYRHWNRYTGDKRSHLFLVNVDNGALRDLTPNDPHDVPPFSLGGGGGFDIAPDSREVAFTENPDPVPAISTSAQIYTLDLTNPAAKPIKVSTSAGGNFNPAYSPDGKYLAWRSQARAGYESDKFRLMLYDRAAKTEKDLLPNLDNWVDEFAWGPADSSVIYYTIGSAEESPIFALNVIDGKPNLKPAWLTDAGEYSDLHPAPDGKTLFAVQMTVRQPSEIVALDSAWVGHTFFDGSFSTKIISRLKQMRIRRFCLNAESPTSTTPSSPSSTCPRWSPSGSPLKTAPRSRAFSSRRPATTPRRSTPSSF